MTVRQPSWRSSSSAPARPGSPPPTSSPSAASPPTVLEADDVVGGISRTVERDGWRFDIGGHRFFTKVQRGRGPLARDPRPDDDFLLRPADEPHLLRRQVLRLPARADRTRCATSASVEAVALRRCRTSGRGSARRRTRPRSRAGSPPRFGWRLYRHFFKTYNEKVWGVPAIEIPADWGAQRIKDLSLFDAVGSRLRQAARQARPDEQVTSPDRGVPVPEVRPRHDVGALPRPRRRPRAPRSSCDAAVVAVRARRRPGARGGRRRRRRRARDATRAPTSSRRCRSAQLLRGDGPAGAGRRARRPPTTCATATSSPSRSSCPRSTASPTTGSTSTTPTCKVGRIQNFGSWSPYLVKDGRTCLGLEYFVYEGDELWTMPDDDLDRAGQARARARSAWSTPAKVEAGYVVRMPKAYPVYDENYKANVDVLRELARRSTPPNVHPVGRNGMHRYNNQDHSMSPRCSRSRTSSARRPRRLGGERRGGVPRGGAGDGAGRAGRAASRSRTRMTTGSSPTATISSAGSAAISKRDVLGGLPHRDRERVAAERAQQRGRGQLLHHLDEHEQRGGRHARPRAAARGRRRARGGSAPSARAASSSAGRSGAMRDSTEKHASAWKRTT